ncbi:MAG TPA: two-component system response regulator [Bacteroidales bacterium]|nr:two-component system response regulator [Bacteroidales bacterium]
MKYKECEILIVEDNPNDAELILRSLKKNKLSKDIMVVEDGEEALNYLFRIEKTDQIEMIKNPKVIFLDLKLPKIDGLEVLKCLKSDQQTKIIPVVILTSSKEDPDIKSAYELGANSYVVKPVKFDDFRKTLSHLEMYWMAVNENPD